MIVLPEAGWSPAESDDSGSFLTGAGAPLPLGTFRLPSDPHLLAPAVPDDDPVSRADAMRERAGQVFGRHRAIGAFNRELDDLFASIAESTDWSEGLSKFDQEIGSLRQKHLAKLRTPEDRAAVERHADEFAAMQRIGLKRALVERQHADALAQLDDQLAYYAGKASTAPNDIFRQIAIDAGARAIDELRDAGYLFPEGAEKRQQAFLGLIDGADLETIVSTNSDEAVGILDNPALFPRADAATRQRLKSGLHFLPASSEPPPIRTKEWREDRDGPPPEPIPRDAPAADTASGDLDIDNIAEALAPLVEKDSGLRELLDGLRVDTNDPGAMIRLAGALVDLGGNLPDAAKVPKIPESIQNVLRDLLRRGGELLRGKPRDRDGEPPRQLPPPGRGSEEPGAPPSGGPSPISPPRGKPPLVPPPERPDTQPPEEPPSADNDPFADRAVPDGTAKSPIDPPNGVYHTIKDRDEILARAKDAQPALDEMLRRKIQGIDGAEFSGSRIKDEQELDGKITVKGGPEKVGDYLGGRIVVDSWEALDKVIEELEQTGRVIERDDKVANPNPSGYRAIHVQIEAENGISAEVQVQPREIRDAQENAQHLYQEYRRRKFADESEQIRAEQQRTKERAMFEDAWAQWLARNGSRSAPQ